MFFAFLPMSLKIQYSLPFVLVALLLTTQIAAAQSSNQSLPTAVLSNEINATIPALDLGDPRLTRHFYAFEGVPGDLVITLDSKNLNGDADVFTAVTFRPLMKISIYASSEAQQVAKSLYLRSRQILILRVEARTPNDESGSYHIRFSGAFEPFSGGIPVAEASEQGNEAEGGRKSNVSSVGARIEEPASVPEAKPTEQPEETSKTAPTPAPKATRSSSRRRRGRTARTRPTTRKTETPKTESAKTEKVEEKKVAEGEEKSGTPGEEKPATPKTASPETIAGPQAVGPRLVIEQTDGNRIDRPMSTVRRVVIEAGVIVVTLKNGLIERIPLSAVAKMAIEP